MLIVSGSGSPVSRTRNGGTHHNMLCPPRLLKSTYGLDCVTLIARENNFKAFRNWIWNIYGRDISSDAVGLLYRDLKERTFQDPRAYDPGQDKVKHPPILIDTDLARLGSEGRTSQQGEQIFGAYLDERIYVDMELVAEAYDDDEAAWTLMAVLAEEFGHHLDYVLRNQYDSIGGDSPLEEGAVFASMLIPADDDGIHGFEFAYDDDDVPFKMATIPTPNEWGAFFPEQRIADYRDQTQGQGEYAEFFSATDDQTLGNRHVHMIGHQGIERHAIERLMRTNGNPDGWTDQQRRYVYFGNWQRDFSQFGDPKVLKALKGLQDTLENWSLSVPDLEGAICQGMQGANHMLQDVLDWAKVGHPGNDFGQVCSNTQAQAPPRAQPAYQYVVPAVVDLLAEDHFGPGFRVVDGPSDPYRLGVYIPAEHIDNPAGTTDERAWDSRFRPAYDPAEGAILQSGSRAGLRAYIDQSMDYMRAMFRAAVEPKGGANGIPGNFIQLMYLGSGLHTLEDYFAHSNFCELWLTYIGSNPIQAKTWYVPTPPPSGISVPGGKPFYPITTGVFGGMDTAVSIMGVIAEKLADDETKIADAPEPSKVTRLALILVNRHSQTAGKILSYSLSAVSFAKLPKFVQEYLKKGLKKIIVFIRKAVVWAAVEMILELMGQEIRKLTGGSQAELDDLMKAVKDHNTNACVKKMGVLMKLSPASIDLALVAQALVDLDDEGDLHIHQHDALSISEGLEELAGLYQQLQFYETHEPTHSQLAKDHPTNPCHLLATDCASWAVTRVLVAFKPAWNGAVPPQDALKKMCDEIDKIVRHPLLYGQAERDEINAIVDAWKAAHPDQLAEAVRRGRIPMPSSNDPAARQQVFGKILGNLNVLLKLLQFDRSN